MIEASIIEVINLMLVSIILGIVIGNLINQK